MTSVAILWHMHQPFYQDLVTGEHILPWVRMHALKDYYGMVALMREFPQVKVTFNLVPSLLVQLEAFAENRARDRHLDLGLKPASDLTAPEVDFIRENFFHAHRERMIDPYPRYAELLARRDRALSPDEVRDLQVWHKLAWIDRFYLEADPRIQGLVGKERGYTEEDKALLRQVELELLNRVIPEYREAAARGQIEISASPFYHPILPLLCDTDVYLRTHPDAGRPRQRFTHPEDAAEQLNRAVACHERLFGARPQGLWPSEGSVSDEIVSPVAAAGFRWMATDELILARTLGTTFSRDGQGHLEQPERLYVPYRVRVGDRTVACAFRDHVLSDLIGFSYAGWAAEAAADDFVGRLVESGRRFRERTGGEEAFIPIILDGENAWEHYEGGGRPFLRALYKRLSDHPELRTVTMAEGCTRASRELTGIYPGSWIDADFYIWIGHPDDQKAWSQLADARAALDQVGDAAPDPQGAREEILIAEGSDWCWWYGDDHSSAHDLEFDDLYRRHLRNAYRLIARSAPDELFVSNISKAGKDPVVTEPTALLTPTLDGAETSYLEWIGAGVLDVKDASGAGAMGTMHRADERPPLLTMIRFGFNRERLFVRVDSAQAMADLLAEGQEISLKFLTPPGVRFSVRQEVGPQGVRRVAGTFWDRHDSPPHWRQRGPGSAAVAAGQILEMAVPFVDLGAAAGAPLAFFVAIFDEGSVERERHPAHRPIDLAVPDELFEARHWRA